MLIERGGRESALPCDSSCDSLCDGALGGGVEEDRLIEVVVHVYEAWCCHLVFSINHSCCLCRGQIAYSCDGVSFDAYVLYCALRTGAVDDLCLLYDEVKYHLSDLLQCLSVTRVFNEVRIASSVEAPTRGIRQKGGSEDT